jgi:hypothetical protein
MILSAGSVVMSLKSSLRSRIRTVSLVKNVLVSVILLSLQEVRIGSKKAGGMILM